MGIRSSAKIRADGLKLNNLAGRSPGGTLVDMRTPKTRRPLRSNGRIKKGFQH